MRIVKIKNDGNGFKLIAAENYVPVGKHYLGMSKNPFYGTVFFDFKGNELRRFYGDHYVTFQVSDFKEALKYIFSL